MNKKESNAKEPIENKTQNKKEKSREEWTPNAFTLCCQEYIFVKGPMKFKWVFFLIRLSIYF